MSSEPTPVDIGQISTIFSKQLKLADDRFKGSNIAETFDWKNLKRAPQLLKQKAKLESYTVDAHFDQLNSTLLLAEKRMNMMGKYTIHYCELIVNILEVSKHIGDLMKELLDPYNSLSTSTKEKLSQGTTRSQSSSIFLSKTRQSIFQEEYDLWLNCSKYIECFKDIEPSIDKELRTMKDIVTSKVEEILKIISVVKRHVRDRGFALMDYDKTYIMHENLVIKQKAGELSIKQSQQIHSYERKLEEYRIIYNQFNDLLKREMPVFFRLIDTLLRPLLLRVYYVQLLVAYQINNNLQAILELFISSSDSFEAGVSLDKLIADFNVKNKLASDMVSQLEIVNFRDNLFNTLTENSNIKDIESLSPTTLQDNEPKETYCKALFNFKAQQEGDLSLQAGTLVKVLDMSQDWWRGSIDGSEGIFPGNYVQIVDLN